MAEKKVTKEAKTDNAALSAEALQSKLVDLKKNAMNLRFQHAAGQLPKTHEIRKNRREIARVKTAITAGKK
ncbi:MAG: 50S ribosomal protein L29 [Alphaproteobacteria bacterium]|nr:50S ribosomal protein L29 [Alphaproteobacteria bacterium]